MMVLDPYVNVRPSLRTYTVRLLPKMNNTIDKIRKTTNSILAISMAEPAMFVNPNSAATMAMTKKVTA
jgi:hypothetical protein